MTDRIVLRAMQFEGRHGVSDEERTEPQLIEVDAELSLDLTAAGSRDDIDQTVDYGQVFELCRAIVEKRSFRLLEGIAEALAGGLLEQFARIETVVVRVRKPGVPIDGVLDYAGVEIERPRVAGQRGESAPP